MQYRASDSEILRASSPAEVLGGMQPLVSSAKSNWNGLLIESYRIRKFGPTPRFCFSDRHVVWIQRAGIVKAHENQSPTILYPGSIAIYPVSAPQTSYTFLNARVTVAMLDPAFVRRAVGHAINVDALEIVPRLSIRDEQLDRLVLAAEFEIGLGLPGGRLFLESLGTALAVHLLTHHATKRLAPREYGGAMPKYLLRRAIDFIQANLGTNVSLVEISANVEMSLYHFCRLFKRGTGLSPHQYVKRERVRRAQRLLAEHRLSLVEIANELGFCDQSHFTRTFHTAVGVTPLRYSASN